MKIGESPMGKSGEGSGVAAAERVVPGSGVVEIPLLTKGNYQEWSMVMQVSLEALELWDVVEAASKDRAKDRRAMAVILRGVPPEMKVGLAVKSSAKEAWDAVKRARGGDDRVKASSVQQLMKEFENLRFNDGEEVVDFAVRVNRLTARLGDLGEAIPDARVVKKVLRVVPKKLNQVAVSIEIHGNLNAMTLDELVGQLQVAEEADIEDQPQTNTGNVGQLLLTEAEWEARRRQRGKERVRGGEARRGGDARRSDDNKDGGDFDKDDDGASTCSGSSRRSERRNRGRCFTCGGRGHIARDCPDSRRAKALLADAEEEATLL